jgi:hypothetical protein
MDYYDESIKSLELSPRHDCCDKAKLYLFPPHRKGEFGDNILKYRVEAQENWYLELGDESVNVGYCPWCGAHLTQRAPDAGDSGE